MKLILASKSPRRNQILKQNGFEFEIISSTFKEINFTSDPFELTKSFALGKAQSVYESLENKQEYAVLGSDTVVYFNGKILGKPKDSQDATNMLKSLSGNTHLVISAFAIITQNKTIVDTDCSEVTFNRLTPSKIDEYVASGLPIDKAGSYGIQDGYNLVHHVCGSFNNVVGLPTEKLVPILTEILK